MLHIACDRCKRTLDPQYDVRYVVKIEVHVALEPLLADNVEDDRDHLAEIHEALEGAQSAASDASLDDAYQQRRFDMCAECFQRYQQNPLAVEPFAQIGFTPN